MSLTRRHVLASMLAGAGMYALRGRRGHDAVA